MSLETNSLESNSLETKITQAWQRQALWLWLLLPISWLYGLIIAIRQQAYKLGLAKSYRAPIPIMVIGNITVGGSGKTPLIMALVDYLQQHKVPVGVISRGYGGDSAQMPALVTTDSLPSVVGDEPSLIVAMTGVPMAVCPNRQQAITTLIQAHPDLQLIIADDGLQHYALQRDIEWIVVDVARGFGNNQLLLTGFLREPMSRLDQATVIYHKNMDSQLTINDSQSTKRLTMHLQPDSLQALWPSLWSSDANGLCATLQTASVTPLAGSQVHGVSGIGYPQRFFATLEGLGFQVSAHPYPDHYDFKLTDLLQYKHYPIVVTSKDAVKMRALLTTAFDAIENKQTEFDGVDKAELHELVARLWVLPVSAELSDACYDELRRQLQDLGIAINNATY